MLLQDLLGLLHYIQDFPFNFLDFEFQSLTLHVTFDPDSETEEDEWTDDKLVTLTFYLTNFDSWAVKVLDDSLTFNKKDIK